MPLAGVIKSCWNEFANSSQQDFITPALGYCKLVPTRFYNTCKWHGQTASVDHVDDIILHFNTEKLIKH